MRFKSSVWDNYRYLNAFRPFWDAMQNSIILATLDGERGDGAYFTHRLDRLS